MPYGNYYTPNFTGYNPTFTGYEPNYVNRTMQTPIQQQYPTYQPGLSGRRIANINEVMPNDIPMDGNMSLFPYVDGSCIYGKYWDKNGMLQTVKFVPEVESVVEEPKTDAIEAIMKRFDDLENLLK